ncbi:hypothetical protein CDL15_Pgr018618 [Punica granatum]|uniref:Uncharacterized protein n=1 Tax=Punica granatum TaxID=22663 RepID=A0A218WZY9_PUNGR|nr:hypothetical protein CDL15_Pgr018618 [Punica granatum]PKI59431.1 hypothetical protein CRG98_020190 [Punica granatum]
MDTDTRASIASNLRRGEPSSREAIGGDANLEEVVDVGVFRQELVLEAGERRLQFHGVHCHFHLALRCPNGWVRRPQSWDMGHTIGVLPEFKVSMEKERVDCRDGRRDAAPLNSAVLEREKMSSAMTERRDES